MGKSLIKAAGVVAATAALALASPAVATAADARIRRDRAADGSTNLRLYPLNGI